MKMLICSIGSKQCESTLRFGAEVAKALSADTTLLLVVDKKRKLEGLKELLDEIAHDLAQHEVPVQVRVEVGDAETIVVGEMEATDYELVAVGALGTKRSRKRLLDSVAMRIVERAETSVLVVKGDRSELSRLLICASGSEQGQMAVLAGAALACGAGAEATVLHVVDPMPTMYTGLEYMEETLTELLQSDSDVARELKWAARVVRDDCEIAEVKLRRGIVPDEILRESQRGDYDLIVMGSPHSASSLVRMLMGDLARELLHRAQRPVLIVRPAAEGEDSG